MTWGGGGVHVPALPIWGVLLLAACFTLLGARLAVRRNRTAAALLFGAVVAIVPLSAVALSLPYTFTNGTIADATQVNANFEALRSAVSNSALAVRLVQLPDTAITAAQDADQLIRQISLPAGRWLVQANIYVEGDTVANWGFIACRLEGPVAAGWNNGDDVIGFKNLTGSARVKGTLPFVITVDSPSTASTVTLKCNTRSEDGTWGYRDVLDTSRIIATPIDSITILP
jgi:hypothetical protein